MGGAEQRGLSLNPGELVAALGTQQPPPDVVMGTLTVHRGEHGVPVIEHVGGPLLSLSLALFAQQQTPRFIWVRDGAVCIEGVDPAGQHVELRYRAVGLQTADPRYLGAHEGGYLLLERLAS